MGKNFIEQGNRHYQDPKITNNNVTLRLIQRISLYLPQLKITLFSVRDTITIRVFVVMAFTEYYPVRYSVIHQVNSWIRRCLCTSNGSDLWPKTVWKQLTIFLLIQANPQ